MHGEKKMILNENEIINNINLYCDLLQLQVFLKTQDLHKSNTLLSTD